MKKILLSLIIIAASLNAMATDYAVATLTLKGNTSLEQGEVTLAKTDDPAASSYCAPLYIDQYHVVMYALNGSEKYQIWANADLTNFPLGIKTYSDENYTITVSNVSGSETLILRDLSNNEEYPLVNNAVIEFSAAANSTIEDRFVINYQAPAPTYETSVTTNAYGLATFSYNQPLAPVEASVKLYKGAISGNDLNLTPVADYAAEQGVVVYGEANTTYHFAAINGATADFSGNELKAASTWAYPHAGTTAYVLSGSSLYIYEGENMKPNKAFLLLEANSGNAPRRISFRFNGATAFENVEMNEAKAVKFMEDGKVFIKRGDAIYNLQGQLVK